MRYGKHSIRWLLLGSLGLLAAGLLCQSAIADTNSVFIQKDSLSLASGAVFDIQEHTLVVGDHNGGTSDNDIYTQANSLDTALQAARNGGTWDGTGLQSTALVYNFGAENAGYAIGNVTNATAADFFQYDLTTLHNLNGDAFSLTSGTNGYRGYAIYKPTYVGDLQLRGKVTMEDVIAAAGNIGQVFDNSGPGQMTSDEWAYGDVLHHGIVDMEDIIAIASNLTSGDFPVTADTPTSPAATPRSASMSLGNATMTTAPEPGTVALLAAAALALLGVRLRSVLTRS